MTVIASLAAGAAVCIFGMWAFLRGQRTMFDIMSGQRPELFDRRAKESGGKSLASQMREMFADDRADGGRGRARMKG
jgi:hypothetical protein